MQELMEGWPEDDGPGWDQMYDNESRRWHEECAKRLARCEADMRVMRKWPEYRGRYDRRSDNETDAAVPTEVD